MNFGSIFGNAKSRLAAFPEFPRAQGESRTKTAAAATPAVLMKFRREVSAPPCARFFAFLDEGPGRLRCLLMLCPNSRCRIVQFVLLPQRHVQKRQANAYFFTWRHASEPAWPRVGFHCYNAVPSHAGKVAVCGCNDGLRYRLRDCHRGVQASRMVTVGRRQG